MIRIQCDCCGRVLDKYEHYVTCKIGSYCIAKYIPTTVHLCESCLEAVMKSWEVVKREARG